MLTRTSADSRVLYLIAAFKIFKALVLLAVGVGAHKLLDKRTAIEVYNWANVFRIDPGNRYLRPLLVRFSNLDPKKLKELSVATFFYAALLLTEGVGLMLGKRWAQYFTLITTSTFIPLEIYELVRRASFARGIVLLLNLAVVIYLAMDLRSHRR